MKKTICLLGLLGLALLHSSCREARERPAPASTKIDSRKATTPSERPQVQLAHYIYTQWSDWEADCSRRYRDPSAPCSAVRKRLCANEATGERLSCDYCGGECKEEIQDDRPPRYLYTTWSQWNDHCRDCSPKPEPCKADRMRTCLDRMTGQAADCVFCGGNCKEEQQRMSSCDPRCKWTWQHVYLDKNCTIEASSGSREKWGPQTNSPFNKGCSQTAWTGCVEFGGRFYKWEPCVPGCKPPWAE